jgi:hypothetical protein
MPESAFRRQKNRDSGLRDSGLRDSGLRDQKQHHRRISFREEFLKLLRNHGVEFDERYIWQ